MYFGVENKWRIHQTAHPSLVETTKAIEEEQFVFIIKPKIRPSLMKSVVWCRTLNTMVLTLSLAMISPDQFIPLAKRSGFDYSSGEWVICRSVSVSFARVERSGFIVRLKLSVNLSSRQFMQADLGRYGFSGILEETGVDPKVFLNLS